MYSPCLDLFSDSSTWRTRPTTLRSALCCSSWARSRRCATCTASAFWRCDPRASRARFPEYLCREKRWSKTRGMTIRPMKRDEDSPAMGCGCSSNNKLTRNISDSVASTSNLDVENISAMFRQSPSCHKIHVSRIFFAFKTIPHSPKAFQEGRKQNCLRTTAHPRFEGQLEILAAPYIETAVVSAETLEESSIDGEETPGHRRRPDWLGWIAVPLLLPLRDCVPVELTKKNN